MSKQSWGWWFETPSRSLWGHCNENAFCFTGSLWRKSSRKGLIANKKQSSCSWFQTPPSSRDVTVMRFVVSSFVTSISSWHSAIVWYICRLCCQKQVSQAGISNCIPQNTVGCNYLSLPEIPATGVKVFIYSTFCRVDSLANGQSLGVISPATNQGPHSFAFTVFPTNDLGSCPKSHYISIYTLLHINVS